MRKSRQQLYAILMILFSIPLIFGTIWLKYVKNFTPIKTNYKECILQNSITLNGTLYYCSSDCFVKFSKTKALFKSLITINPCLIMVKNKTFIPNGCIKVYLATGKINSTNKMVTIIVPYNFSKQEFYCKVYNLGVNTSIGSSLAVPKGY